MPAPTTALAITQPTLYILLLPPLIYLLVTHSRHSLPGYIYLLLFTTLQLISTSLQLSNPESTTSAILSSVGLFPLLLGLAGILHAAHTSLTPTPSNAEKTKLAWAFQLALHLLTVGGVVMVAISTSNLTKNTGTSGYNTDLTLRKFGAFLLLLAFPAIVAHAAWILLKNRSSGSKSLFAAKKLLLGASLALPFVFVRLVYTVVYEFADPDGRTSRALSPVMASFAVRVVFVLVAVVGLVVGGLLSRRLVRRGGEGGM